MQDYGAFRAAFDGHPYPLAFLDRRAFEENIQQTAERAGALSVRIASKSVRCRGVLKRLLREPGFEGLMCYTGNEATDLAAEGFDDLLVAYPVVNRQELSRVANVVADGTRLVLMVDDSEHVERIGSVATEVGADIPVCIDLDLSTEHFGIYFGVQRSPIRTPQEALAVAETINETRGIHLVGVMGYEAQLAGLPDHNPANTKVENIVIRQLKKRSRPRIRDRRRTVVEAVDTEYDLEFVNGGGTGSVEFTRQDPSVTEVTVGSAFYAPRQFDWYDQFSYTPAAGFTLEVTRRPASDVYTCRGGGYIASGPAGTDKSPIPHRPTGARLRDNEGAGEVQTPIRYAGDRDLRIGDPIVFRHGKAGEVCRFFEELHVVEDDRIVDTHTTYRGDDRCYI